MNWRDGELKNPFSGELLRRDSPHSLSDGKERFPVIENIPFLRANREVLRRETLAKLDAGDERGALILLLQDQDDWAKTAAPTEKDLRALFENNDLTLRGAMEILQYGAVADYFAFRWSDPTFLSGLCLLENHLPPNAKKVFELACGIGHYLREFALREIEATGADVVFSKLWLARKFVAPNAKLICFDANYDFPFVERRFDAAFCHDAFYFLPQKLHVAAELKKSADAILIGHAHNADAENFSSGAAISTAEYAALFDDATFYDDAELSRATIENRAPQSQTVEELKNTEAVSLATTEQNAVRLANFTLPPLYESLRVNPLLDSGNFKLRNAPDYPSERYAEEYAPLSGYLNLSGEENVSFSVQEMMFYGHWDQDEKTIELARRRIFLDLPDDW